MQLSQQQAYQAIRHIEENAGRLVKASARPDLHIENAIERLQGMSIVLAYSDIPDMEHKSIMIGISEAQSRLSSKLGGIAA